MKHPLHITVVGSGVIGLSSGIRLLEAGHHVTVLARDLAPHTTSSVAAALWHPGEVTAARAQTWCTTSLTVLTGLASTPAAGVKLVPLHELADKPFTDPGLELAADLQLADQNRFPAPFNQGYSFTTARLNTPSYMPFLVHWFKQLGGQLEQRTVQSLTDVAADLVINASGVDARELAHDTEVYPIRGQVLRVTRPTGLADDIVHVKTEDTFTYIVPREDDCILGGSYQAHDDNLLADEALANHILERCCLFYPVLAQTQLLEHKVGLRPGRKQVRLEPETIDGVTVIHNYGHGSIGHTLAWGCAAEVVDLVGLIG